MLNPSRYLDQKVTITGQFSGRNLLGEMPDAPGKSRYDFVLRSTDAAIWVTNMRPKVKDANGKDFELGLDARIDTGRWLTLRGTVQQARGLLLLDAEAGSLALAKPPTETQTEEEPIRVPAGPPPEVIFSAPTQDETDVLQTTTVRIQFSRDIDQATLKGRIKPHYLESQSAERGEPVTPTADFTFQYAPANRVLESQVHQAARTLPDAEGRPARGDPRHRRPAAQAVDAHVRARRSRQELLDTRTHERRRQIIRRSPLAISIT